MGPRRFAVIAVALVSGVVLTACGSTSGADNSSSPPSEQNGETQAPASSSAAPSPTATPSQSETAGEDRAALLEAAVRAYSDTFLTADAESSYDLLSDRCQARVSKDQWELLMASVEQQYGTALPIRTYEAEISGDLARVTYAYDVAAINQDREPWVWERQGWRQDDC